MTGIWSQGLAIVCLMKLNMLQRPMHHPLIMWLLACLKSPAIANVTLIKYTKHSPLSFLFPPRGEVGLRDPREHSHGVAHDMGTTISVKDSRGELPVGTLGCYICLKKPDGNLLPGTFGLTCHHVVFNFTGDASLPSESHLEITHLSQRDYENTIWTYEQRKGNLGLETHEWTRTLNV